MKNHQYHFAVRIMRKLHWWKKGHFAMGPFKGTYPSESVWDAFPLKGHIAICRTSEQLTDTHSQKIVLTLQTTSQSAVFIHNEMPRPANSLHELAYYKLV
jgi:hypothetical protein